jgi:phosphoglycolate phosphatase
LRDLALVFDLDGTLIDSAPDIHAAALDVLAAEGLPPLDFATVKSFIGRGVPDLIGRMLAHLGQPDPAREARMVAAFMDGYEGAVGRTTLYPGVMPALAALAGQGVAMGLCTNKPQAATLPVIAHFGLAPFIAAVAGGDTLPVKKPDPAPLHHVLAALGRPRALFVGDSEVDAETAARAGVPFLLHTRGYRRAPAEALDPAARFDHWDAFPALVARLTEAAA